MKRILVCVGARPNLMKAASLFRVADQFPAIDLRLLHTGQHYSGEMDRVFFEQLQIPNPDFHLEVGSGSHAVQTAEVMKRLEPVLLKESVDLLVVLGDINSTVACALVAQKMGIQVAHVESGLRSFDMRMPEEVNRRIVDHISDYLFTTEASGNSNLLREGINPDRIFFVGNTMIDTLIHHLEVIRSTHALEEHSVEVGEYAVLTLHRPSNVDDATELLGILGGIAENVPSALRIVFPVHPRTRKSLDSLPKQLLKRFVLVSPQPYFAFMSLVYHSVLVLTDSGGIQEETTYLRKPCFTLRASTERPVTTEIGSNFLIHKDLHRIKPLLSSFDATKVKTPELWDGKAGVRILERMISFEPHPPGQSPKE